MAVSGAKRGTKSSGGSSSSAVGDAGHRQELARARAARQRWVTSGEVVPAKRLAEQWGLTPRALGPAVKRGELFSLVIKRERYYPSEFLTLGRDAVKEINQALGSLSPEEKLVFWKRPHGALEGETVADALKHAPAAALPRVIALAKASFEQG